MEGSTVVDIGYMECYIPIPNIARSSATFVAQCKSREADSSTGRSQCRANSGGIGGTDAAARAVAMRLQRMDESIMIARHEVSMDKMDIWARIAAPVAPETISWRQDGRAVQRDGKY